MDRLITKLKSRLAADLPGEAGQFRMAPRLRPRRSESLSMQRHWRRSAVLLYLFPRQQEWHLVLMKRPAYDGAHGGQISIPGGRLEAGESYQQAALREFAEETGVMVDAERLLGTLTELHIPISGHLVKPYVAFAEQAPEFHPDPVEVEQLIEFPLSQLLDEQAVQQFSLPVADGARMEAPCFVVAGHRIWGATAMILSELKELLRQP